MRQIINSFSTRIKLIFSFGVILLFMISGIVIGYLNITSITETEVHLRDIHSAKAINLQLLSANINFNRYQIARLMLADTQSEINQILEDINSLAQDDDEIINELSSLDNDPAYMQKIEEVKNSASSYRETRKQIISLIQAGKLEEAKEMDKGLFTDQFMSAHSLLQEMANNAIEELDAQLIIDQGKARTTTLLFVIIGAVTILIAIGFVATLSYNIAHPLNEFAKLAEKIGNGDLTVEIAEVERMDEIGVLTHSFRKMVTTLRESTTNIHEAVELLSSSAGEILASTTQIASSTSETATSINETSTTVEEVRQAVQLSSQKAQSVSDNAKSVAIASQSGLKAVEETAMVINLINKQMETIAQTVVLLSEQSQSIGGIIASVTDLADQSNLLSVNAAIEAAKAGEHGKGFSVVAQEIKNLSQQSKQATMQVREILSDIQKAISSAVMATEQGSKVVETGVKQVTQTGEAIKVLTEASDESVQAVTQIVISSQQQEVGMEQIAIAMENINQAGGQNATSVKQMEVAARNLNELGEKLKELMQTMSV